MTAPSPQSMSLPLSRACPIHGVPATGPLVGLRPQGQAASRPFHQQHSPAKRRERVQTAALFDFLKRVQPGSLVKSAESIKLGPLQVRSLLPLVQLQKSIQVLACLALFTIPMMFLHRLCSTFRAFQSSIRLLSKCQPLACMLPP